MFAIKVVLLLTLILLVNGSLPLLSFQPNCLLPPPALLLAKTCCANAVIFNPALFSGCGAKGLLPIGLNGGVLHVRPCVALCVLEKAGVWTNNAIDRDLLVAFVIENLPTAEWKEAMTAEVDACLAAAAAKQAQLLPKLPLQKCNRTPEFLIQCIQRAIIKTCPAPNWSSTAQCTKLRSYVNTCPL